MEPAPKMTSTLKMAGINTDYVQLAMDHYRRESNWLKQVNELHGRMAGARDLSAMVEAFTSWLEPIVSHDLIGFLDRDRSRAHLLCSLHGPSRRCAIAITHEIMVRGRRLERPLRFMAGGFHVALWQLDLGGHVSYLVIIRRGSTITDDEARIIEQAKLVIEEPMRRALDYEDIYEQARRDALTGLPNRRVVDERMESMLESAARHRRPLTLAALDLDRFKAVNDKFGHAAGDRVLRKIASAITGLIRKSDLLARVGGDEFLLALPDTSVDSSRVLAERICRAVGNLRISTGDGRFVGISIGLAEWRRNYTREEWTQQADEALYQAKKEGRHRVCISEMR
jgi:diguanylate cyclase (GGDEF)-like protein